MEELEYEAKQKEEAEEEDFDSKKYATTELSLSPPHHWLFEKESVTSSWKQVLSPRKCI